MVRTIVFIVLVCVALMAGLSYYAPTKQGTLTLNPAPTFPETQKTELGRTVARIVPFCPGMSMVGKHLSFTNLESTSPPATGTPQDSNAQAQSEQLGQAGQAPSISITFTVPDGPAIPAAWGDYASPCTFRVEGDFLYISGASCQAICLGKQPAPPQDTVVISLNPKAQNKQ